MLLTDVQEALAHWRQSISVWAENEGMGANHRSVQDVCSSSRQMPITEAAADHPRKHDCAGAAAAIVSADGEVAYDAHHGLKGFGQYQLVVTELA